MNLLILGCGTVGVLVGYLAQSAGHAVLGVRRTPSGDEPFAMRAGDLAERQTYDGLVADAVLLAANPGLRRGRDNGLAAGARLIVERFPAARFVYTASTAVYPDAAGGEVDEASPIPETTPAIAGLIAIERAVLTHANALVLRCPALIGPTRTHALERLRAGNRSVTGALDRPFPFLDERDCAGLCLDALNGAFGTGVLNAVAPERITLGDYYRHLAARAGVTDPITDDDTPTPSRRVSGARLWAMTPGQRWRSLDVE